MMQTATETRDGNGRGSFSDDRSNIAQKRKRTRSGCLNCRGKRRKCDEVKPVCVRCKRSNEKCEWGMRVAFRPENTQTAGDNHPLVRLGSRRFRFMDITPEVIRDNRQTSPTHASGELPLRWEGSGTGGAGTGRLLPTEQPPAQNISRSDGLSTNIGMSPGVRQCGNYGYYLDDDGSGPGPPESQDWSTVSRAAPDEGSLRSRQAGTNRTIPAGPMDNDISLQSGISRAADLSTRDDVTDDVNMPSPQPHSTGLNALITTPEGSYDDGIFLPGSTYLELHSTLRNSLIKEVRSNETTHQEHPERVKWLEAAVYPSTTPVTSDLTEESLPANMSKEEEYELWKNWLDEIAPWLDKFDSKRHFQNSLPILAQSHDHLRYAMLAVSARQLERMDRKMPIERSLALYQQAIHLLLPQLHTRSTAAIASCVVLCVLEMLSCSPKAWKRHLDGCASLMEAVGINGFVGGVEQALFWCFARMDVCGGLITSVKTLIPASHWASRQDLDADIARFKSEAAFESYANQAVYLCAQVLDLLASYPTVTKTTSFGGNAASDGVFAEKWSQLWHYLDNWPAERPEEMNPILTMTLSQDKPFPTILYSNAAAISGNQLYHTASILMLQQKPPSVVPERKPRSIFWHARQICAISLSNDHHGAWTNCIQPLWVAGQWLSHPAEHNAILGLLERIEKESGWGTKWRAQDLKDLWGEMEE